MIGWNMCLYGESGNGLKMERGKTLSESRGYNYRRKSETRDVLRKLEDGSKDDVLRLRGSWG